MIPPPFLRSALDRLREAGEKARQGPVVLTVILGALAFLLPLTLDLRLEDMFDLPKVTLFHLGVMGLGWAWIAGLCRRGELRGGLLPLDAVVAARWGVGALCTVWSVHRYTSVMGSFKFYQDGLWSLSCYAVIYFVVSRELRERDVERVLGAALWAGFPVSLYAMLQGAGRDPTMPWMASSGWVAATMGNPNFLGALLAMLIPLGAARLLGARNLWRRSAWLFWLACVSSALLLTRTRSAWLGCLAALGLLAVLARRELIRKKRVVAACALAGFLLVGAGLAYFPSWRLQVAERAAVFLDPDESSARARFSHWETALKAALENPFFGSGLDTFGFVFAPHQDVEGVRYAGKLQIASNAHNEILQTFATTGLLGLFAYVWFWVRWIRVAAGSLGRASGASRLIRAGWISSTAALWVHAQFNFSVLTTWFYFWVIGGALSREAAPEAGERPRVSPRAGRLLRRAWIAATILAAWVSARHYMASREFVEGIKQYNAGQIEQSVVHYRRAVDLNPGLYPAYFGMGTAAGHLARTYRGEVEVVRRWLDVAVEAFERDAEMFPLFPMGHQNLAMAYMWRRTSLGEDSLVPAFREINRALSLGPAMPDVWDHLGQMHDYLGNRAAAVRAWARAVEAAPSYFPAWDWLHKRLPAPPFELLSQSVEIPDVPLGRPVGPEGPRSLKIMNEGNETLTLSVKVLDMRDTPLVAPDGFSRLDRPGRFIRAPAQIAVPPGRIISIPVEINIPDRWRNRRRRFVVPLYIGISGEQIPGGRFCQLLICTI